MNLNVINQKSFDIGIESIQHYETAINERQNSILPKRIMECSISLSIIANSLLDREIDFENFTNRATKLYNKGREIKLLLQLLKESDQLKLNYANRLLKKCDELLRLLILSNAFLKKDNSTINHV